MKFLVSLVVFSLVLNGFASAQTLIQDSCRKAVDENPQLKYDFCVNSLTQDPQSKTAIDLKGLVLASIKNAAAKNTNVKGIAENILKDKRFQVIGIAINYCVELYEEATEYLNSALASVQWHDYFTAKAKLKAALDAPSTCEDRFKGKSPLTNDNNILFQKILIPLAFSNML